MASELAIQVENLGVHFRRNRRGGRSLKDLFGGSARRTRPGEFWALLPLGLIAAVGATTGDNIAFALGRRLGTTRWAWMPMARAMAAKSGFSSATPVSR